MFRLSVDPRAQILLLQQQQQSHRLQLPSNGLKQILLRLEGLGGNGHAQSLSVQIAASELDKIRRKT